MIYRVKEILRNKGTIPAKPLAHTGDRAKQMTPPSPTPSTQNGHTYLEPEGALGDYSNKSLFLHKETVTQHEQGICSRSENKNDKLFLHVYKVGLLVQNLVLNVVAFPHPLKRIQQIIICTLEPRVSMNLPLLCEQPQDLGFPGTAALGGGGGGCSERPRSFPFGE